MKMFLLLFLVVTLWVSGLHVVPACAWDFSGFSGFLPLSENMFVPIRDSTLPEVLVWEGLVRERGL